MYNALSIDLEFWYSGSPYSDYSPSQSEDQIEAATYPLLNLLQRYHVLGTFFILGEVAEKHPALIKEIYDQGHEIASHGYSHRRLHFYNKKKFEIDLIKSIAILSHITGERPIGYRAPSFSLDNTTIWALDVLQSHGFLYDSSVFPVKMRFYGEPWVPLGPYHPSLLDITKADALNTFLEFPVTVYTLGNYRIPISGGFYFRMIPTQFLSLAIRKINQNQPALVYIHPWESYRGTPKLNLPFWWRVNSYYGRNHLLSKLEQLILNHHFTTMREVLRLM